MRKYRYLISYSGLALTTVYIILTISLARDESHYTRNCIAYCGEGLITTLLVLPGIVLSNHLQNFEYKNLDQVVICMSITALLLYIIVTALEKLVCYFVNLFRRSNIPK